MLLDVCCERLEDLIESLGPIYMGSIPAASQQSPKADTVYQAHFSLYSLMTRFP